MKLEDSKGLQIYRHVGYRRKDCRLWLFLHQLVNQPKADDDAAFEQVKDLECDSSRLSAMLAMTEEQAAHAQQKADTTGASLEKTSQALDSAVRQNDNLTKANEDINNQLTSITEKVFNLCHCTSDVSERTPQSNVLKT